MEQRKNNREELIKEILEEEEKLQQYVQHLEQEIKEIKKRIIIKQQYLDTLSEYYND